MDDNDYFKILLVCLVGSGIIALIFLGFFVYSILEYAPNYFFVPFWVLFLFGVFFFYDKVKAELYPTPPPPNEIKTSTQVATVMEDTRLDMERFVTQMQTIINKYNPGRGSITSMYQGWKAGHRADFLVELNRELDQLVTLIGKQMMAVEMREAQTMQVEMRKLLHSNDKTVLELATSQGLDLPTYKQMLLVKIEIDKELLLENERARRRIGEEQALSRIRMEEKEHEKLIESNTDVRMLLRNDIREVKKKYFQLKQDGAPKRQIDAVQGHLNELENELQEENQKWENTLRK
jgi:flagellar biosynthesis chaperone FliJ